MKFLNQDQRKEVGFQFILDNLNVQTPFGNEEKNNITPFKRRDCEKLRREFGLINDIGNLKRENPEVFREVSRQFMRIKDIRNTVYKCMRGECLDEVELFEIKIFSMISVNIFKCFDEIGNHIEELILKDVEEITDILDPTKRRMETFYIYEEYSEELRDIREKKKDIENRIYKTRDADEIDALKEERLKYVVQEEEESFNVRKDLTSKLMSCIEKLNYNIEKIGRIDFLISKVELAQRFGGVYPEISKEMEYSLVNGNNPYISSIIKNKNKGEFTPINIELKKGSTIITGANMGGKSITLKTIVLNMLLFQCGFYVFAEKVCFPLVDFIYLISDDMQSISKGLSTFGAEIMALKHITEHVKVGDGLVAFDEFARGTNPYEGKKLVRAVTDYFHTRNSISLFATHYDGVVQPNMEHYQVKGLKDVNFEALKRKIELQKRKSVEIIQEHMDYGLVKVEDSGEVPKDALNIAMLLGMDKQIVLKIEELYNEEE